VRTVSRVASLALAGVSTRKVRAERLDVAVVETQRALVRVNAGVTVTLPAPFAFAGVSARCVLTSRVAVTGSEARAAFIEIGARFPVA